MGQTSQSHEAFDRDVAADRGSERSFALVFAAVFCIVGLFPLLGDGGAVRWWALGIAAAFVATGLVAPRILRPLNAAWYRFGLAIARVVNPVVMGLLFFVFVTPMALVMRALGKNPLKLRFDPEAESYWIERQPPGPAPGSLNKQF